MSPHAVNNFVSDLVLMAQAMEKLPQVEAVNDQLRANIGMLQGVIDDQSKDLEQSRTYAATLEQRVHDLEVARDDAELSFLEADERTSRALDFVKALFGNAGALIQALEPVKAVAPQAEAPSKPVWHGDLPKDEPVAAQGSHPVSLSEPINEAAPQGQSEIPPTDVHSPNVIVGETAASITSQSKPQGQREPDPTATVTIASDPVASDTPASSISDVTSSTHSEPAAQGPYHGKNYYEWPSYVEYDRWIAGGGTEWDYYNRRERSSVL